MRQQLLFYVLFNLTFFQMFGHSEDEKTTCFNKIDSLDILGYIFPNFTQILFYRPPALELKHLIKDEKENKVQNKLLHNQIIQAHCLYGPLVTTGQASFLAGSYQSVSIVELHTQASLYFM